MSDEESNADAPVGRVAFQEGSIGLPTTFEDRTSNVFVPADTQNQPNLSIARDWLREDETLPAYVERQLAQLKSRLPGHKVIARTAERLGQGAGALEGERVDAQYRNGQQVIRQRQAVFLVAPRRALIFTASTQRHFDAQADALWQEWLGSFVPPPAGGWPVAAAPAAP